MEVVIATTSYPPIGGSQHESCAPAADVRVGGQSRRFGDVCDMSALPPTTAVMMQCRERQKRARKRHHAGCSDIRSGRGPLPTAWPILYLAVTDFELVRELPTGRAEVLVSGSADAVGRRAL